MTVPRSQLINSDVTSYYLCTSRCVRRARLIGKDPLTGVDFAHRRQWIEDRLQALGRVFAIDLCGYAVMSNHYHVVLHINVVLGRTWSDEEVVDRWSEVYKIPEWFRDLQEDDSEHSRIRVADAVARWRRRLTDISWFMRCLNEPLARLANQEDECSGRFWEGRFDSRALLDEEAVLQALVYVDLNPVRAAIAATPEESDHTSIQARIEGRDSVLAPMVSSTTTDAFVLPVLKKEYIALVDWTGRQWRADKPGFIDPQLPPIFERLTHPPNRWLAKLRLLLRRYYRAIGTPTSLLAYRIHLGQQRLNGLSGPLMSE